MLNHAKQNGNSYRSWVVASSIMLFVVCAASTVHPCSIIISHGIIVNRLRGNVQLEKRAPESCTVELRQLVKKHGEANSEIVKSASCNEKGDFDIGEIRAGHYHLRIKTDFILEIPVIVTHLQDLDDERPGTFLNASLRSKGSRDCFPGEWSFDSTYEPKPD